MKLIMDADGWFREVTDLAYLDAENWASKAC